MSKESLLEIGLDQLNRSREIFVEALEALRRGQLNDVLGKLETAQATLSSVELLLRCVDTQHEGPRSQLPR